MSEPKLENIEDYDTLKGEKKRVVLAVLLAGLIIGAIYVVVDSVYGEVEDGIKTEDTIKKIPLK
jgi:hypothetical protein